MLLSAVLLLQHADLRALLSVAECCCVAAVCQRALLSVAECCCVAAVC